MPASWFLIVVAPFIGSFLGLVAIRLPGGATIIGGRSHCDHCGRTLAARDLIPVLSWLWLRGRCRYCRAPIGLFALAIEFGAIAVAVTAVSEISGWLLWVSCAFGWGLLLLAAIDWRVQLLPDALSLPLLAAGLITAWFVSPDRLPLGHIVGAVGGFVTFVLIALIYRYLRGREGMGFGDAKLAAALGAWVSWEGLPSVVLLGSVMGLVLVLGRAVAGQGSQRGEAIPFGTFLAIGGWIVWLYGPLSGPI
ncbi:MAG TPA: A24 family peptidase [Rhizomicrobium sp.]|jgi:leader peptidase (prepilin peptidase)/N-methyltransferase